MILKVDNIDIEEILTSGACFRYIKEEDGSFTNILKDRVINIKQNDNNIIVNSSNMDNIKNVIYDYFDLNRDYNKINKYLKEIDSITNDMVCKCEKYRILNQDSFEMCISYIISQNNNVKRISKSIEKLCELYGKKIVYNGKNYYLFPTYESLKNVTKEEFKSLGVGFRDKYLVDFIEKYPTINNIDKLCTEDSLNQLLMIKGIGMKVASCILLFGYKRLDVYPIDTWVKKYVSEKFNIKNSQKEIEKFTKEKYKEYSGLVIQYMFHSNRNK